MTASAERFGQLLTQGIHSIKAREGKTIATIEDELGYLLGKEGGAAIGHYRRGRGIPPLPEVEKLGLTIMKRGLIDQAWLEAFLRSAGHPAPAIVVDERLPRLTADHPEARVVTVTQVEMAAAEEDPPFKGLQFFDVSDASIFFGREQLTAELVAHLRQHHLLAVVGASGSGKSSVVRAGLVPALRQGRPLADGSLPPTGSAHWPIHILTPTAHPLKALAVNLTRDSESLTATTTLLDDLAADTRSLDLYVSRLLSQNRQNVVYTRTDNNYLLLVVDQFEELFTLCHDADERKAFVDNLFTAAAPDGQTVVVLTLRADFYAACAEFDDLRTALERYQRYIGPLSQPELRRAIEEPAQVGQWSLEPALVELILGDVGHEPGALPLLSHALLETWKRRRERTLTVTGYVAAGRVQRAIAQTAESVLRDRLTPVQQTIARQIFLRLTELGDGTQDTRRRVGLAELMPRPEDKPVVENVLTALVDARLVTTDQDEVEVAHEALIREWPTLRQWLTESREWLRLQRRLSAAAQEWAAHEYVADLLYGRIILEQTLEKAQGHEQELNDLERDFLQASQEAIEVASQRELAHAQALAEAQSRRAEAERQRAEE